MRRAHGTGSVYPHGTRPGKWVASLDVGWTRSGTRKRVRRLADSEQDARRILRDLLRSAAPEATASTTVKTWCDEWLTLAVSQTRPSTFATNRSCVQRWIVPTIGKRKLTQLTPADIRSVSQAVLRAGLAPSTAHRAHVLLAKILKDAAEEGHAVPARLFRVAAPKKGESQRGAIPLPDALAILATVSTLPDASRWVAALLQGMRPAECRGLTWEQVDLHAGTIDVSWQLKPLPYNVPRDRASGFRIPPDYTARPLVDAYHLVRPKTGKGRRIIPLVEWMEQSLREWRASSPANPYGLVWPADNGRPMEDHADRRRWRMICDLAGVGPYDLYQCRHSTATLLRQAGVDDQTIIRIMGHSSILSTLPYIDIDSTQTRAALEAVAERLGLRSPAERALTPDERTPAG